MSRLYTIGEDGTAVRAETTAYANATMVPDYNSFSSASPNLISANGGTWTADRTGFIRYYSHNSVAGQLTVPINGKTMVSVYLPAGVAEVGYLPVVKGDTVQINHAGTGTGVTECFFVQPRVAVAESNVVDVDVTDPKYQAVGMVPDYEAMTLDSTGDSLVKEFSANYSYEMQETGFVRVLVHAPIATAGAGRVELSLRVYMRVGYQYQTVLRVKSEDTSPAGTDVVLAGIVPVARGDRIGIYANVPSTITLGEPLFYVNFIPPKLAAVTAPVYEEEKRNWWVAPDYPALDETPAMSEIGTPWVADRDGYLRVLVYARIASAAAGSTAQLSFMAGMPGYSVGQSQTLLRSKTAVSPGVGTDIVLCGTVQITRGHQYLVNPILSGTITLDPDNTHVFINHVPPAYKSVFPAQVTADYMNVAMTPDYANQESLNRISTDNGTWIADRTGFVSTLISGFNTAGQGAIIGRVYVGNRLVRQQTSHFLNNQDQSLEMYALTPVAKGDTVRLTINLWEDPVLVDGSFRCYFIPPKFTEAQAPVIVSPLPSYSAAEQATGERWVDGRPIYRRTYNCGTPPCGDTSGFQTQTMAGITDLDYVVKMYGIAIYADTRTSIPIPSGRSNNGEDDTHMLFYNGRIILEARATSQVTAADVAGATCYVTLEYTKA
jgi:hypothetical protein